MIRIGIIGLGFVGSAVKSSYDDKLVELTLIDPAKGHDNSYDKLVGHDAVFVCVPSPQGDDGSCDTSILESVLTELRRVNYDNVIISKVTAPPDYYTQLQNSYDNLVHAPEFLTAANATKDYINGEFLIIGGNYHYNCQAEKIIRIGQVNVKNENVRYCEIGEASLSKYIINCFLSTKVIFMNEMYQITRKFGFDYDTIIDNITLDNRIGKSHNNVPGPDGFFGFGGYCFPKDTAALLSFAKNHKIKLDVLQSVVDKNKLIRNE